jgi:small subunit ribosomal protein S21
MDVGRRASRDDLGRDDRRTVKRSASTAFAKVLVFMIRVKSRGNETAEQMIRRFKKACEKEGLTKDIKRIAFYEKPSEKRRRRSRSKPRIGGSSSR